MKSSFGLLAMLLGSGLSAHAAEVRLGEVLSAGFGETTIADLPTGFETGYQPRWGAALAAELSFGGHWTLLASPGYLEKGGTLSETGAGPESKYDFGYLEVPVGLRYAFGGHKARPFVVGGASVGFLLTAKLHPGTGPDVDLEDRTRGVDVGLLGGIGVEVPARRGHGFFEVVAIQGLRDINALGTMEIHQRTILLRAGWTFGLRRGRAGEDAAGAGR